MNVEKIKKLDNLEELEGLLSQLESNRIELVSTDPYWDFKPTTDEITDSMKSFLSEYLEEIDMPQRVDGQLDAILSDKEVNLVSGGNQSGKSAEEVVDGTQLIQ
jgi:hypothetical protein